MRPATRFVVCAGKAWSISACKNLRGHHPLRAEIWSPEKIDLGGCKLTCPTFWIVDQSSPTCYVERGRNRSRSLIFPILDILSCSGDIRDQSRSCVKSRQILHVFDPKFFGEGPPNFWTCIINSTLIVIKWQSFVAIVRGSSEIIWRIKKINICCKT